MKRILTLVLLIAGLASGAWAQSATAKGNTGDKGFEIAKNLEFLPTFTRTCIPTTLTMSTPARR